MPALKENFRYSTGPLYSRSQLETTERYLAEMGLTAKQDAPKLGARIYSHADGKPGNAVLYLDEVGAAPMMSGVMLVSTEQGGVKTTTVWDFAKEQSIAHTKNPLLRKVRQTLSI